MKNKKNEKKGKYLLGLLIGVIALGVGYAALGNVTLNIFGTATATGSAVDSDFIVRFVRPSDSESENADVRAAAANPATREIITGEDVTTTQSVTNDTSATFNVEGMVQGDEVRFTYYVANLSNGLDAEVTPVVTNNFSDNFLVTVNPDTKFDLDLNEVQAVTVTVKCIAQDLLDKEGSFTISFTADVAE